MNASLLHGFYRDYIDCLNARDWDRLDRFVHPAVEHNGRNLGLSGYRDMLRGDVDAIPDLRFRIEWLVCEPPAIAARLSFDCTPTGMLFGLPVNGRRVRFAENVFYRLEDGRLREVRSVLDKLAVEAQLGGSAPGG
ncbi:ester cyclase [Rhizosaccharibacter radicis]|uniref:Ester cyclase n=1 Tax=Rhizosaccharibacter radicis TaxID=2782605 RepID=A0ABT1VUR1_9PROT|nr:ester cyclase [Acetobacteraceae bacterium KSS12]